MLIFNFQISTLVKFLRARYPSNYVIRLFIISWHATFIEDVNYERICKVACFLFKLMIIFTNLLVLLVWRILQEYFLHSSSFSFLEKSGYFYEIYENFATSNNDSG